MSAPIKKARSVGGVILIAALAMMFLVEMIIPEAHVTDVALVTITSLIGALLGIDAAVARKGRIRAAIKAYFDGGNNE